MTQHYYPLSQQKEQHKKGRVTFDSLPLELGGELGPVTLAYETWGTLNVKADNAILITHALTASAHAHDENDPHNPKAAWWNLLIGPNRPFDTNQYFVICSNVLGSCYGSTGPSSVNPQTGKHYGLRFPLITIRDIVMAQRILLEHLGVPHLAMVAGGSLGGQQALEWVVTYPDFVDKVAVIAATAALTAQAIAFNEVARQTILADVAWLCGDYLPDQGPHTGLAIARMLATITYQSEEGMESRFARNLLQREEVSSPTGSPDFGCRFDIENYLYHQGNLFTQRFDANSYLYLTRAMDLYTLEQRFSSLDEAICHLRSKALFIGIDLDFLFPAARVHWLAEKICHLGGDAQYIELRSPHGHDAFLKEWGQMADALHVLFK